MHITDYEKAKTLVWNNLFIFDGGDEVGTRTIFAGDMGKALLSLLDPKDISEFIDVFSLETANLKDVKQDSAIMVQNAGGTKQKMTVGEALYMFGDKMNRPSTIKNALFRGKNIGTVLTDEQRREIQTGRFHELFLGDYWENGGIQWMIADFNYWMNAGQNKNTENDALYPSPHHLAIVPIQTLYAHRINDTTDMSGAYVGSKMYRDGFNEALSMISGFANTEDDLYLHNQYLSNSYDVSSEIITSSIWANRKIDLMTSFMVFGYSIRVRPETTVDCNQLSIFRIHPFYILPYGHTSKDNNFQYPYWLRDPIDNSTWEIVSTERMYSRLLPNANDTALRPVFGIGGWSQEI